MTSFELLSYVVTLSIVFLSGLGGLWLKTKVGKEKVERLKAILELKKDLVREAILFVQQAYETLDGDKKLGYALQWLISELAERGIKATEAELRGLIEAILKQLKKEFGDDWESVQPIE